MAKTPNDQWLWLWLPTDRTCGRWARPWAMPRHRALVAKMYGCRSDLGRAWSDWMGCWFESIGIQQPFIQIDGWTFWFDQSHFQAFWHFQFKSFDDFQASEHGHWCFSGLSLFEVLVHCFFSGWFKLWTFFLDCFSGLYKEHPNRQLKPTLKGNLVQCFVGTWNMRFCYAQWAASVGSAGCRKVAVLSILIIPWIDIRINWW